MNINLIRLLGNRRSFSLLNVCVCRSINSYSHTSITELNKYLYIDEDKLQENVLRDRDSSFQKINILRLKFLLKVLRQQSTYRYQLTQSLKDVDSEMKKLKGIMNPPNEDIIRRIALCENRKTFIIRQKESINQYYSSLNALVLNEYLSFPNHLHENTPKNEAKVIFQSGNAHSSPAFDHLIVGKKLNVLNYLNSSFYYLLNEAALLEFACLRYFSNILQDNKFQSFLNPDTCNNFIVDGISDGNADSFFKLEGDKLTLVGGSSFSSLCALRVGRSVHSKYLPERNVTTGRSYVPQTKYKTEDGLYSAFQRSNVHLMIASETKDQMNEEFHNTLELLKFAYEKALLDFRISYQSANHLLLGESLRANIELYSAHLNKYVEVAHLSMYGDFVSKRLLMLCHDKNQDYKFLNLIEGVAVSYPTLLAYLLERSNEKELRIPECIKSFMYKKL